MALPSQIDAYLKALDGVSGLYTMAALAKEGLMGAYFDKIIFLYEMQTGGLMFQGAAAASFALTAGVPIATMAGVYVALGSGYYQAREQAKQENKLMGFAQGFVMAISNWRWSHVVSRFRRYNIRINVVDEAMNDIRVKYYHEGLKLGFLAGVVVPADVRKQLVSALRKAGNISAPKEWSANSDVARNQQIDYVIEMAAAGIRSNLITM
ncbi:MAG: hypothetical protein J5I65_05535 [Aridibacter famidurans]|nr:hypothetical protein [Aridibacter famidurans]